jgi:hypothetical protein
MLAKWHKRFLSRATKSFYLNSYPFSPHGCGLRRMLSSVRYHLFLAFGTPGFASDEPPFKYTTPTTGAAVIIKKSDVKDHLSPRRYTGIHLHQPASQPDATGFSGEDSGMLDSQAGLAVQKSSEQPASSLLNAPAAAIESDLKPVLVPTVSKSAQA